MKLTLKLFKIGTTKPTSTKVSGKMHFDRHSNQTDALSIHDGAMQQISFQV